MWVLVSPWVICPCRNNEYCLHSRQFSLLLDSLNVGCDVISRHGIACEGRDGAIKYKHQLQEGKFWEYRNKTIDDALDSEINFDLFAIWGFY